MRLPKILSPLHHRSYRIMWSGQVVSDLGDWLDYLALMALLVYQWHLGPGALAALSVTQIAPWVLVGPFAGVWADRLPRRAAMVVCDLARGLIVAALFLAPNLYIVLILVFVKGVFSTAFTPAKQSYLLGTVPPDQLLAANSLSQMSTNGAKVVGPALGGLLLAAVGARWVFIVDAVSFVASALILSRLPELLPAPRSAERGEPRFWDEFKTGIAHLLSSRPLLVAVGGMTLGFFVIIMYDSLSTLALNRLGVGESLLGLAMGAVGLGTVLGAALIGQWGAKLPPLHLMATGKGIMGVIIAGLGLLVAMQAAVPALLLLPACFVIGAALAAIMVPYSYTLQRHTPPEMIGRVSAVTNSAQTTFGFAAPMIGALIAQRMGIGPLFIIAGAALLLVAVLVFAASLLWDRAPAQAAQVVMAQQLTAEGK